LIERHGYPCLGGVGHGLIGGSVEQGVEVGGIVRGHLEQPGRVGVLIDRFRCISGSLIDFGHGAGDRRVNVSGSLDRFDDGDFLLGGKMGADFRQFDKTRSPRASWAWSEMPTVTLPSALRQHPFVGGGVFEVGGDVGHGFLLNGGN
jgi:hypothetical protein